MSRIDKLFLTLLLTAVAAWPHPCQAALIRTYDLDSLCYMSTDVVVATLGRLHHDGQQPWQDTFAATVVEPLVGQYHRGDVISSLYLDLYNPAATGQRCILFVERRQYFDHLQPSQVIPPCVADMLLIDGHGRVRRYFQWSNPGGLVAQGYTGYSPSVADPRPESDALEQSFPTIADAQANIVSRWAAVDKLRPLLSHEPRPEDVPTLLALLRQRRAQRAPKSGYDLPWNSLEDGLAVVICSRLADLTDPAVALDAMAAVQDDSADWLSGLTLDPFTTEKGIAYARAALADPREVVDRRLAAADVLNTADEGAIPNAGDQAKRADRAVETAVALSDDTPEALRLVLIPRLNLRQPDIADSLRRSYHLTHSEEVQFTIEAAFISAPNDPADALYDSLHSSCGPVLSILRRATNHPVKPHCVGLTAEIIPAQNSDAVGMARECLFTNTVTRRVYRVNMESLSTGGHLIEDLQMPLPPALPRGSYRIALEFRQGKRLVSIGHSVLMTLPLN